MDRPLDEQRALTIASPRLDHGVNPRAAVVSMHANGIETEPPREPPRPPGVPALITSPTLATIPAAVSARVRLAKELFASCALLLSHSDAYVIEPQP